MESAIDIGGRKIDLSGLDEERIRDGTLNSAGNIFLFADNYIPKFFLVIDPLFYFGEEILDLPAYVAFPPWDYIHLHSQLHWRLNNSCRSRTNKKIRRNGNDSMFSNLIRHGADSSGGCFDTPFIDIDRIVVAEGKIVSLVEIKHPLERTDTFQSRVLSHFRENVHWMIE